MQRAVPTLQSYRETVALKQKIEKPISSRAKAKTRRRGGEPAGETVDTFSALHDAPMALNESYGETRLVAVAVDPYLIHVYWEVTSEDLKKASDRLDDDYRRCAAVLRFYDVGGSASYRGAANYAFDVNIDLQSRSRYVHLWSPGKPYLVELGFGTEKGSFYPIVRSNVAETPRAAAAPQGQQAETAVHGHSEQTVSNIGTRGGPRRVRNSHGTDLARSQLPFGQGGQALFEQGAGIDLVHMSEKGFTLGVSSKGGASPRKEKVPADR